MPSNVSGICSHWSNRRTVMVSLLRDAVRHSLKAAFLKKHRGGVMIGKHCHIPFNTFHADVQALVIGDYVRFGERVGLYGGSFRFGNHFYCGDDVFIAGYPAVFEVGKFSSFGSHTAFLLGKGRHRLQSLANFPFGHVPQFDSPEWSRHVDVATEATTFCKVGHDVWIGARSVIFPNVTIGHGAIITAGSVVASDIPPYAIVGGNPAQIISFRFRQSLIGELLELKWWDWPEEKIHRNMTLFTKNLTTRTSLTGLPVAN